MSDLLHVAITVTAQLRRPRPQMCRPDRSRVQPSRSRPHSLSDPRRSRTTHPPQVIGGTSAVGGPKTSRDPPQAAPRVLRHLDMVAMKLIPERDEIHEPIGSVRGLPIRASVASLRGASDSGAAF
jgi:hypothetical protein